MTMSNTAVQNDTQANQNSGSANQDKNNEYINHYLSGNPIIYICLLYTSPSPRDRTRSRMPSSA